MYTHLNTHTSLIQMMVLADSVTGFKVPVGFGPTADGRCDCRGDTEGPAAPPNLPLRQHHRLQILLHLYGRTKALIIIHMLSANTSPIDNR